MTLKTKPFNSAEIIGDEETAQVFLEETAKEDDAKEIARITRDVATALGMMQLARSAGMPTKELFDLINPWNGDYDLAKLREVGLRIASELPKPKASNAA